jgi:hypothetical protein
LTEVVVFCFKIIILTKKAEACFITSLVSSIGDGNISRQKGRTAELELLEFLPRWLRVLYIHVALRLLCGLGAFLFGWFLF